jgi:hypothetical protein
MQIKLKFKSNMDSKNQDFNFIKKVEKLMDGKESCIGSEHFTKISMLDERYAEDIYLIILQYFVRSCGDKVLEKIKNNEEYPYMPKFATKEGKGLTFRVNNLPEDLQKIIVRYLITISN